MMLVRSIRESIKECIMQPIRWYTIEYFWEEEYHTVRVETSSGDRTARMLALDEMKAIDHFPYGKLKIISIEDVDE